jgi:hypothetical protein
LLCQFFGQKPGCRSTVGGPEFGGIFNLGMIPQMTTGKAAQGFQKQALTRFGQRCAAFAFGLFFAFRYQIP